MTDTPRTLFRHLCVIARHVLNAMPEARYPDVIEAVKCAAARARIPYRDVHKAVEAVMHSTKYRFSRPLVDGQTHRPLIPAVPAPRPIPRSPLPAGTTRNFTDLASLVQELVRRQPGPSRKDVA